MALKYAVLNRDLFLIYFCQTFFSHRYTCIFTKAVLFIIHVRNFIYTNTKLRAICIAKFRIDLLYVEFLVAIQNELELYVR